MAAIDVHMRQINHFLTLVESGSFGRASQKANISQPALSKSVKQLEDRLQVKLIDRTPKGVMLTVYGEAFIEYARAIRSEMSNVIACLDTLKGIRAGSVTIGAGPSVASNVLPKAIARLMTTHPGIGVNVIEGMSEDSARALMCGEIDLAVGGKLEVDDPDQLIQQRLYVDRCVVICRKGHEVLNQEISGLNSLAPYNWMLTAKGDGMRERLEELYIKKEMRLPTALASSNSVAFMRTFLAETDFLGFLPKMMLHNDIEAGRLETIEHPDCAWEGWVYISYRKRKSLSPLARALVRQLQTLCEELGNTFTR